MAHMLRYTLLLAISSLSFTSLPGCAGTGDGPPSVEASEAALIGEWQVEELDGQPLVASSEVALTFGSEGAFAGDSGVNRLRASYSFEGDTLQISEVMATRMAGPPELMEQEARLMSALAQARGVEVSGDHRLRLLDAEGEVLAVARAGPAPR